MIINTGVEAEKRQEPRINKIHPGERICLVRHLAVFRDARKGLEVVDGLKNSLKDYAKEQKQPEAGHIASSLQKISLARSLPPFS